MNPAKEYLEQIGKLNSKIEVLLSERSGMVLSGVSGIRYDKDRVQTSPDGDAMLRLMVQLDEHDEKIAKEVSEYMELRDKIVGQINAMSNRKHAEILYLRYAKMMDLHQIADTKVFDYGYIRKLHGKALSDFRRLYPNAHT